MNSWCTTWKNLPKLVEKLVLRRFFSKQSCFGTLKLYDILLKVKSIWLMAFEFWFAKNPCVRQSQLKLKLFVFKTTRLSWKTFYVPLLLLVFLAFTLRDDHSPKRQFKLFSLRLWCKTQYKIIKLILYNCEGKPCAPRIQAKMKE